MLLPWYSRTVNAVVGTKLNQLAESKPAITVFSFVEAAIFVVAAAVVALVLARGDRRAFHLPGGDGTIVAVAGAWATFLIFYRFVDKPDGGGTGQQVVEYGLSWGIFFGLLAALGLLVAGLRLRAAHVAEPALPSGEAPGTVAARAPRPAPAPDDAATRAQRRQEREERRRAHAGTPVRERKPSPPGEAPTSRSAPEEQPTRHVSPDDAPTEVEPPRGAGTSSFEPPEFQLPPPRRREP